MGGLKQTAKHLAAFFPPIRRLLAHRDALHTENDALQQDIERLTRELKTARSSLLAASREHREMWTPAGHFYSPIPAVSDLKMNEPEIFSSPPAVRGVDLREAR